jgi:hypothetical protein
MSRAAAGILPAARYVRPLMNRQIFPALRGSNAETNIQLAQFKKYRISTK